MEWANWKLLEFFPCCELGWSHTKVNIVGCNWEPEAGELGVSAREPRLGNGCSRLTPWWHLDLCPERVPGLGEQVRGLGEPCPTESCGKTSRVLHQAVQQHHFRHVLVNL